MMSEQAHTRRCEYGFLTYPSTGKSNNGIEATHRAPIKTSYLMTYDWNNAAEYIMFQRPVIRLNKSCCASQLFPRRRLSPSFSCV